MGSQGADQFEQGVVQTVPIGKANVGWRGAYGYLEQVNAQIYDSFGGVELTSLAAEEVEANAEIVDVLGHVWDSIVRLFLRPIKSRRGCNASRFIPISRHLKIK